MSASNLSGLKQFIINELDVRLLSLSMSFDFSFERLVISGQHSSNATFIFIPLTGAGPVQIVLNNARMKGSLNIESTDEGFFYVNHMNLSTSIQTANVNLTGVGPLLDEVFSNLLSTFLPAIIRSNQRRINGFFVNLFVPAINSIIGQYNRDDLVIAIVSGILPNATDESESIFYERHLTHL